MPRRVERHHGKAACDQRLDESKEPARVPAPPMDEQDGGPFPEGPRREEPIAEWFLAKDALCEGLGFARGGRRPRRRPEQPLRAERRKAGEQRRDRRES